MAHKDGAAYPLRCNRRSPVGSSSTPTARSRTSYKGSASDRSRTRRAASKSIGACARACLGVCSGANDAGRVWRLPLLSLSSAACVRATVALALRRAARRGRETSSVARCGHGNAWLGRVAPPRWRCARGRRAARFVRHVGCSLRRRLPVLCRRDGDAPNHRCEKAHSALSLLRARFIPRPICSILFSAFRGAARARVSVCLSTSPLSLCLAAARGRRATSTR